MPGGDVTIRFCTFAFHAVLSGEEKYFTNVNDTVCAENAMKIFEFVRMNATKIYESL